jgi:F0F1-type ATP synthase epsilon subunit
LEAFREQERKQRKELKENLRLLEEQRKAVYRGGAVSVGKYSLQLVAEISSRSNEGARKRDEKAKEKERERLASEKERQKKAIEDQCAALSKG